MRTPRRAAIGILLLSIAASPALALEWVQWEDSRSGMRIAYPADFFVEPTRTDESVVFTGTDAILELSARDDLNIASTAELRDLLVNADGYASLTYSPGGQSWMVASGYRDADIYYEKFFVRDGSVRAFSVQYPTAMRATYDPIVERLEDSFQPW